MAFCTFGDGGSIQGVTAVENIFIADYMPSAPGDYVKVYLFGLMLCARPQQNDSLPRMAESLHMDENVIVNAMAYWEREGLVFRVSDNPPAYNFKSLYGMKAENAELDDEIYTQRSFNRSLQQLLPEMLLEGHEFRMASDWIDVFGLSEDCVLYMVQREVERRGGKLPAARTLFKHLDETARRLADAGVKTAAEAEEFCALESVNTKTAEKVMKQFGMRRAPSVDEINLVKKWTDDWKYTPSDIIAACAETVKSYQPSFAYLDKVLEGRLKQESGANAHKTEADISAEEAERAEVKKLLEQLGQASRVTPAQTEALKRFKQMGFEYAAIEDAAKSCAQKNRRTFEDVESLLAKWKDAGVFTLEGILEERRLQEHYSGIVRRIFERAGIDRRVTASDIKYAKAWTELIELDAILYASELAQGTQAPMKYIHKLVQTWSAAGITTAEKARESAPKPAQKQQSRKYEYEQRDVRDEDFEEGFFVDLRNRKKQVQS